METYHKINAPFKRYTEGRKKGKLIGGDWSLPEFEYLAKNQWEFTEKVDGTNIRINLDYDEGNGHVTYAGRTDKAVIPEALLLTLTNTFGSGIDADPRWFNAFEGMGNVTLFGEGYGPKIQSGGKYREDHSFVLFDVMIGGLYLSRENVNDIADKLGIDSVPVIGQGTLEDAIDIVTDGYVFDRNNAIVRYGRNGLKSAWGDFLAEGIIAVPVVPLASRNGSRIITKIKTVDFQ